MLSQKLIEKYKNDGLIKSSTQLPVNKINEINFATENYLKNHKRENNEFVSGLYEKDETFLKFAMFPEILEEVKQLIGNNVILWGSSLFCKVERNGKETPWYQDGEYWPIKPLESITVWLAIDEVTQENGPLQYIPGSHIGKKLEEHETLNSTNVTLNQKLKHMDKINKQPESVLLKEGMFSLHDVYLFHGSKANKSGKRRAGITYRYIPTTSLFDKKYAKEIEKIVGYSLQGQLHLVSGVDYSSNDIYKNHTIRD